MTEHSPGHAIPYGVGYDAPKFYAAGTVAAQKKQIIETFGLEGSNADTLAELVVEAALVAHGLVNASTLGVNPVAKDPSDVLVDIPDQDESPPEPPKKRASKKKSIAAKARSNQPEDETDDIAALVAGAPDLDALADVYKAHKDKITDEQLKLFSARKEELGG